jgi:hypothetical protein
LRTDYFRLDMWYEWEGVKVICPIPFLQISDEKFLGIFSVCHFNGHTRLGLFNVLNSKNVIGTSWNKTEQIQQDIYDLPRFFIFGYNIRF